MPSFKKHYDYIVIGAGSGGLAVGIGLKNVGKDVLIVGKDIGGECTHTGCIPSKTFLSLAMHYVWKSQKQCNIELRQGIFERIRDKVNELEKHDKEMMTTANVPFLHGIAKFISNNKIEVEEVRTGKTHILSFNKCIISTGSRAQRIHVEGLPKEKIITNYELFKLKELPNRVVIFGGGPIGTENGTAFSKFCTHTTIVVRSQMIPHEPPECVAEVRKALTEEYDADIFENIKDQKYDVKTGHLILYNEKKEVVAKVKEADYYMMALGRLPNIEGLNLEKAGVEYIKEGISVNHNLQTTNKRIFAIGDVIPEPKFTHLSVEQAKYIVKRAVFPWVQREKMPLPAVTFSDPPIASVGDLKETEYVKRFVIDFTQSDRGRVESKKEEKGVIFVEMTTGNIKGASMVGHFAEHAINFFTLAIVKGFRVWEFDSFMVPYPTIFNGIEDLYYQFLTEYKKNWKFYVFLWLKQHFWTIAAVLSFIGIAIYFIIGLQ